LELDELGWDSGFENAWRGLGRHDSEPARVAQSARGILNVLTRGGERPARLAGRLLHDAAGAADLPVVGDWVAVDAAPDGASTVVRARLPRRSRFARKAAGRESVEQVVAANLDTAFLVTGLDHDFNPRRLERYLTLAANGGVTPVVVLNKVDLRPDLDACVRAARAVAPGTAVVAIGARDGIDVDVLARWLGRGRTVALLGSSGAGKSTLVNRLLGEERVATAEVRPHDDRGRHTTTRRELHVLPGGGLLVDTPGLRELQLWAEPERLDGAFPDLARRADDCRFRDCTHRDEPGCAVREAVRAGEVDPERLLSWTKLGRELEWVARRRDRRADREASRRQGREYKRILRAKRERRR